MLQNPTLRELCSTNHLKFQKKAVVRHDLTTKYFPATRRETRSPHLPPSRSQFLLTPNSCSPAYPLLMRICLLELSETQGSGSRACISRPSGWMKAKTCDSPHLHFPVETQLRRPVLVGQSTKFISSLYWKLMVSFCVTFSLISLVLILSSPAGRVWSLCRWPPRVHVFLIVVMHPKCLLGWKDQKLHRRCL